MSLYFIGILAPEEVNQQVLKWKEYLLDHFNCKKALRLPAHVTLIPPFRMQDELEMPLAGVLEGFVRSRPGFSLHLQNFGAFPRRVIYVHVEPVAPLVALKAELEEFLSTTGGYPIKREERPFHPHITIASRDLREKDFSKAWAHFRAQEYDAVFEVGAISLLVDRGGGWKRVGDFALC